MSAINTDRRKRDEATTVLLACTNGNGLPILPAIPHDCYHPFRGCAETETANSIAVVSSHAIVMVGRAGVNSGRWVLPIRFQAPGAH